ncbi:hypothetical protein [Hymenobacter sp. BT491]|uniref:hypothetical protein n=1 Tax=Hymenobacter sp. BT491 TaxID=2766779 RepID=UPI001653C514|nr:hypothetical protein [Hymenobacter sp. BT491]MBC6989516.1 hypothetical protein [Hymenobacter sp. BT491]
MKTTILATALLLSSSVVGLAQTASTKPKPKPTAAATPKVGSPSAAQPVPAPPAAKVDERANALTDNMRQALALTPQQTEKVRNINLNSVRGVETARLQYRTDVRKMASVVDDIGQSRLAALKEVLTPQQFDRYQRKREEKMGVPSTSGAQGNPVPGLPGGE